MLVKKIYRLDYVRFFYHDRADGEDVEIRKIIGFFSSEKKVNAARELCNKNGKIDEKFFQVKEFDILVNSGQKFVYYVFLDYSVIDPTDNRYVDYLYIFPPQSSYKKCKAEKETILSEKRKSVNYGDSKIWFK